MTPDSSDHDLLRAFVNDRSQAAFSELVRRHVDLVYSAARRQVRSPQLAEEIAQSVFIDLARHAAKISAAQPLAAWLHLVTRRTAIDVIRRESRRQARENEAAALAHDESTSAAMNDPSPDWPAVEPLLDEAVASLAAADRTAILLRYFENKSLRDVGAAFGTSDDAAQKRVTRALERLRAFLLRRGVTVTAAGLATELTVHAIEAAPAGLGATIATSTIATTAATGTTLALSRLLAMTSLQKSALVAAFVLVSGAGVYHAAALTRQAAELTRLRGDAAQLQNEAHSLHAAQGTAATRLQTIDRQIDARLATTAPLSPEDAALESQLRAWLTQLDRLKQAIAARPEWNVPALQLLTPQDWIVLASGASLDSPDGLRRAAGLVRSRALNLAINRLRLALNDYLKAHDGTLPANPRQLAPFFEPPLDETILDQFVMTHTGKIADLPAGQQFVIATKPPVDLEFDSYYQISPSGLVSTSALSYYISEAQREYAKANGGQRAVSAPQLTPYLQTPIDPATVQRYLSPRAPSLP